jgi:PIN domain nuclease of toxin-antitoxin system
MALRLLLDTHAAIWWSLDQRSLSNVAFNAIEDAENDVFFSPVTAMEIATKVRIGKLDLAKPLSTGFASQMTSHGFKELALTAVHGEVAGSYAFANQDPWDRLLIAQAQLEGLALISNEKLFDTYGVDRLW